MRLIEIKVTHDLESQAELNLKKFGAYEYSIHPETKYMCYAMKASDSDRIWFFDYYEMQRPFKKFPIEFQKQWLKWRDDSNVIFSAHNSFFETCMYRNILVKRFGWPYIGIPKLRCTAAKAAAVAIPRNLADAGAVQRLSTQKDYEGHRVMLKLCKPTAAWTKWKNAKDELAAGKRIGAKKFALTQDDEPPKFYTPESAPNDFAVLYKYCKIDVLAEEKLDYSLPDLSPIEQKVWEQDQRINLRGVQVDMPLVKKISAIMATEAKTMNKELDVLTLGLVSSGNARNAILDFLTIEGLELPDLRAKTVDDFLKNGQMTGDAKKVLQIRQALAKSSTAKYQTFLRRAMSDGRVRDILLYHGASTGRWGGVGIQPQNFPRGIIKDIYEAIHRIKTCDLDELKLLYGENLMPLFSSVLRGMFIASPGHDLFVEDYSAIECRVTFWLAGHEAGLQMFRDNRDPYKEMAVDIYKKPLDKITDEQRQVGKAAVLGCGFQMGNKKFVTSAWDVYRAKVDSDMAKIAVSAYREVHSPVTELWDNLNEGAIAAVENPGTKFRVGKIIFQFSKSFLWAELPSGRRLAYKDPQVLKEKVFVMVDKNGERLYAQSKIMALEMKRNGAKYDSSFDSKKLAYMAVNHKAKKEDCMIPKWTRERTYGGKLLENLVQATSRDLLANALGVVEKKGFNVLWHSHDENVSEAPKKKFDYELDSKGILFCPEYRAAMEALPAWAEGLPLKAGGWVNERYRKG